ncbi:MAG: helix-turn-helix transcriptional regulator [candidate division WOR-3 bacterium]|nr:helix-turn-helix transcriptional regulator [candidate division WOR-3 bacterium]
MFIFTKELGIKLRKIRQDAGLTQKEVAQRIGFRSKSAQSYIARLESGAIKNPRIRLILDYLRACNYAWSRFFSELSAMEFERTHNKIMAELQGSKHYKKIDRDVMRYRIGLQCKASANKGVKSLSVKKQNEMTKKFLRYRADMEKIEADIREFMGNTTEPGFLNQYYKAFARECYRTIKKYGQSPKSEAKIEKRLLVWQTRGLKKDLLEKILELVKKHIQSLQTSNQS